jgi:hypothetical protein
MLLAESEAGINKGLMRSPTGCGFVASGSTAPIRHVSCFVCSTSSRNLGLISSALSHPSRRAYGSFQAHSARTESNSGTRAWGRDSPFAKSSGKVRNLRFPSAHRTAGVDVGRIPALPWRPPTVAADLGRLQGLPAATVRGLLAALTTTNARIFAASAMTPTLRSRIASGSAGNSADPGCSWDRAVADRRSLPMDLRGIPRRRLPADPEPGIARHGVIASFRLVRRITRRLPARLRILKKVSPIAWTRSHARTASLPRR